MFCKSVVIQKKFASGEHLPNVNAGVKARLFAAELLKVDSGRKATA
jgi:hypothetical protein